MITGLQRLDIGDPLPISVPRAKGYNCGLVAILDKAETVEVYAKHQAHLEYVILTARAGVIC